MLKKLFTYALCMCVALSVLACAAVAQAEETVLIYSSAEEYRNAYYLERLNEVFPDYNIIIEYMPSGNQAAKIRAERGHEYRECDIVFDVDYSYLGMIEDNLAVLEGYDQSIFMEDAQVASGKYLPQTRNGGAVIVNLDVLEKYGLPEPTCYEDLLNEEWKDMISMPNPKSSGTGYLFLKSLVNAWGEDEAFDYFEALSENILQFTSSGSGPVNSLVQGEVAVGLGMTAQAVKAINEGVNLKILFFEEGSPSGLYGYGIIEGKQNRACVREVFDFFYSTLVEEDKQLFYPEQIYKDKIFEIENYPTDIQYADMSNDTTEEKTRLLGNWEF